jgi:hypothetical protein
VLFAPAPPAPPGTLPEGWSAAAGWRRLQVQLPAGPERQAVRDRAIDAVVARARELVRHAVRPTRTLAIGWPDEGDLDLDETLERPRPWGPDDLRLRRRSPREADVVAVLDMSLSMPPRPSCG